ESANLDPAEIAPEPLLAAARWARRFRLDLMALSLLIVSLLARVAGRVLGPSAALRGVLWAALVGGALAAAPSLLGSFARTPGVGLRRGAPLLDAASPTAETVGSLREGEVVPLLETSGDYVRVEDSSGARGWAPAEDVRALGARVL